MLPPSLKTEASSFNSTSANQDSWWQQEHPKLVLLSDFSPALSVNDVQMASAELIGTAYSATVDNGVRIVVKRLKSEGTSEWEFKHHMDIAGNVKYANVAPLRAYYVSDGERISLYDYFINGSVYALLHGGIGENRAQVAWRIRREIAIGTAVQRVVLQKSTRKMMGCLSMGTQRRQMFFLVQSFTAVYQIWDWIETTFMPDCQVLSSVLCPRSKK